MFQQWGDFYVAAEDSHVKEGVDVNACDYRGHTPLTLALKNYQDHFAIAIMKSGANVNAIMKFGLCEGYMPLMIATL